MRNRLLAFGAALALGLTAVGVVAAQQPTGVVSELQRIANTTPEEKIAYAEAANEEIAEAARTIEKLHESAKRDGATPEAIQCLTQRLNAVRTLGDVSLRSTAAMRESLSFKEIESADHEFRKIAIALSKVRGLLGEAYTCTGEETLESGSTQIDYTTPDDFDDDIGNPDDDFGGIVDLPGTPGPETAVL